MEFLRAQKQQPDETDHLAKQTLQEALAKWLKKAPTGSDSRQITMVAEGQATHMSTVERTIDQIFEIRARESLQNDGSPLRRVYFTIDAPDKSFGQDLQERLEKLIDDWDKQAKQAQVQGDFAEANPPQTPDYLYGIASGYQQAIDDLRALIVSMEVE